MYTPVSSMDHHSNFFAFSLLSNFCFYLKKNVIYRIFLISIFKIKNYEI